MKQALFRPLRVLLLCLLAMLVTTGAAAPVPEDFGLPETMTILIDGKENPVLQTLTLDAAEVKAVSWTAYPTNLIRVEWTAASPNTCAIEALDVPAASPREVTLTLTVTRQDDSRITDTCVITVGKQPGEIQLTDDEHFLEPPAPNKPAEPWLGLWASILPSNVIHDPAELVWSSSNPEIASVTAEPGAPLHAMITPHAVGRTIIKAELPEYGLEATCVIEVSGVTLPEELTLIVGKTYDFSLDDAYQIYGNAHTHVSQWTSTASTIASVSSGTRLVARKAGQTTLTLTMGPYSAQCDITVEENLADAILVPDFNAGQKLSFSSLIDELAAASQEQLEDPLSYITGLSVPTEEGVLYYGYISPDSHNHGVGGIEQYYVSASSGQQQLSEVSFVPHSSFSGTAIISYTGVGRGGGTFKGTIRVTVVNSGDVTYSTPNNGRVPMVTDDFAVVCQARTGGSLRYVMFPELPDPTQGTLYYQYNTSGQYAQKVSATTRYRSTGEVSLLSDVTFVPNPEFVGTISIPYRAYNVTGGVHHGTMTIQITPAAGSTTISNISYYASVGSITPMVVNDFAMACAKAGLDETFSHVYFHELPNPLTEGTLYYNYVSPSDYGSHVTTGNRYYGDGITTPALHLVSFVPANGFLGTVTIPYTGYNLDNVPFHGKLLIHIREGEQGIRYTTGAGWPVTFQGLDFDEACRQQHKSPLSSITFQLPLEKQGVLYYDYLENHAYNTPLSPDFSCNLTDLSQITFVPAAGFLGTVTIPFNGRAENGATFAGSVRIDVLEAKSETVRYSVGSGGWVHFSVSDFNAVSTALTGENVDYISFTYLPNANAGVLYQDYRSASDYGEAAFSEHRYYQNTGSDLIGELSFAAHKDFLGTVLLPFRGVSVGGVPFQGQVEILVNTPTARDVRYTTRSLPVTLVASDFQSAIRDILRSDLYYIELKTLPDSSRGKLMLNYLGPNTGTAITPNSRYYTSGSPSIGALTFLPRAEFTGTVSIPYTAGDWAGNTVTGTIVITVSDTAGRDPFQDTAPFSWAEASIEFLHHYNIVTGSSSTTYSPELSIKRCDFVLMLCRTFQFTPVNGPSFLDVPYGTYYTSAIATAQSLGIVTGDANGLFHPNVPITRQDAMVMLYQALRAAHIYTPAVSTQLLPVLYRDGNQVPSYAQTAMASMVQMGVIRGDDRGMLNPASPIRRAEMAVILHRVLSQ